MFAYVVTHSISYSYFYVCVYAFASSSICRIPFLFSLFYQREICLNWFFFFVFLLADVCRWRKSSDDDARYTVEGWKGSVLLCISLMLSPPLPLRLPFSTLFIFCNHSEGMIHICAACGEGEVALKTPCHKQSRWVSLLGAASNFSSPSSRRISITKLLTMSWNWTHESLCYKTLCWCGGIDSFTTNNER